MYTGEWKDGIRHGKGRLSGANGNIYEGDWLEHKKHGKGTRTWADGTVYTGEWKDDMKHGKGIETNSKGKVIHDGLWTEGEPVTDKQSQAITVTQANNPNST